MIFVLVDAGIAANWRDALTMPADLALNILAARKQTAKQRDRSDKVETMGDGTKKMSFGSIEGLAHALKGAGFSGVKIGADQ